MKCVSLKAADWNCGSFIQAADRTRRSLKITKRDARRKTKRYLLLNRRLRLRSVDDRIYFVLLRHHRNELQTRKNKGHLKIGRYLIKDENLCGWY